MIIDTNSWGIVLKDELQYSRKMHKNFILVV